MECGSLLPLSHAKLASRPTRDITHYNLWPGKLASQSGGSRCAPYYLPYHIVDLATGRDASPSSRFSCRISHFFSALFGLWSLREALLYLMTNQPEFPPHEFCNFPRLYCKMTSAQPARFCLQIRRQ